MARFKRERCNRLAAELAARDGGNPERGPKLVSKALSHGADLDDIQEQLESAKEHECDVGDALAMFWFK